MRDKNNNTNGGLGLSTILFLIFLVLKLCNVIGWSWWWVTSPLWISTLLVIFAAVIIGIYSYFEENPTSKGGKKNGKD